MLRRTVQSLLIAVIVAFGVFDPWMAIRRAQLIFIVTLLMSAVVMYEAAMHLPTRRH
jgi:hypothetical protein